MGKEIFKTIVLVGLTIIFCFCTFSEEGVSAFWFGCAAAICLAATIVFICN